MQKLDLSKLIIAHLLNARLVPFRTSEILIQIAKF